MCTEYLLQEDIEYDKRRRYRLYDDLRGAGIFYGDGKIFTYDLDNVIRIRTGEQG